MNFAKIDFVVVFSLTLLMICFWQLEIIYVIASNELSWSYNFGGLGNLGLQFYTWRDIWYLIICISWAIMFVWRELRKQKT